MHRALLCISLAVLAVAPRAQTVIASFGSASDGDEFGHDIDVVGDVDGDGEPEILIGIPGDSSVGPGTGRAIVVSSLDGHVIASYHGSAVQESLGSGVAGLGDSDLDGFPDMALGVPGADVGSLNQAGQVRIVSGATGALLVTIHHDFESEQLGFGVEGLGDLDDDGVAELGASTYQTCGGFGSCMGPIGYVYAGKSGAKLGSYSNGTGYRAAGLVDGDDRPDYLTWKSSDFVSYVRLVSGATGQVLDSFSSLEPGGSYFGGPVADVDGDGRSEYAFARVAAGADTTVSIRSFGKGTLLELAFGAPDTKYLAGIDGRADVDGDGTADLALGFPTLQGGKVLVVSLRTLDSLPILPPVGYASFGQRIVALDDWSGEGVADLAITAPLDGFSSGASHVAVIGLPLAVPWLDVGHALPGVAGAPALTGTGTLTPGSAAALHLASAAPAAATVFLAGTVLTLKPLQSGTLVPAPMIVAAGFVTSSSGTIDVPLDWPDEALVGVSFFIQAWIADAAAPSGYSASNGLAATTQG